MPHGIISLKGLDEVVDSESILVRDTSTSTGNADRGVRARGEGIDTAMRSGKKGKGRFG